MSAGASVALWPAMAQPTRARAARNSSSERSVRKPCMASSLSSVPPVCPRPRPEIMGTTNPQHAASGARTSETLSPTPPVECLSATGPAASGQRRRSPESSMARASETVSRASMPRKYVAMRNALMW